VAVRVDAMSITHKSDYRFAPHTLPIAVFHEKSQQLTKSHSRQIETRNRLCETPARHTKQPALRAAPGAHPPPSLRFATQNFAHGECRNDSNRYRSAPLCSAELLPRNLHALLSTRYSHGQRPEPGAH
jgi:hypothetical protein